VIFLVLNTSKYTIKSNNDNSISLNDNWTISYNDNSTQSQISLPYNINNKTGEIINIYTTLPPKLYSVEALTLTVYQKSVWIYIDNEQIYEHVFNPSFLNNNPPGTGNVTVILPDNSQNKQLHIKYRIENSFSESFIMPPKIVNGAITQSALSGNNIVIFACMVSFLFIALLLFLMFLMKFRSGINHTANLSLSLIFAAIAIWVLCYNKLTDILINNWQLIHELEYLSLYILPFSIWNYISCGWKSNSNLVKIMRNLMGMFFVVILIMRLIFNIDYSSTLTIFHFLILINVILLIKELSTNFKSKKVSYKTFSFGIFISLFSAILALFQQYFLKGQLYLSVAFTAMIAIAGVLMVISVFCLANETLSDKFSDTFMKNLVYEHKRYEAIFQNTKDIFFDWDTKTDTAYISSNFEKYFGFPPKTSDFKSFFMTDISEISLPDDFDNIIENLKSHQKNEHIECSFRDYNGNIKWFLMNLTTNLNHMGEQTHIIGIIQDITEQKQLKKEFSAQIQYNHISKKMYDNVLEADLSENILLGEGIEELYKTLNIPTNSNYDQTIFAIKTKLTHPDYSEEYGEALSRERILSLFE
ncbi:MAG: PAS domain-containing protein, partial [Oscillospiraceae bacterium]